VRVWRWSSISATAVTVRSRNARSWDTDHHRGLQAEDEALQAVEAVEVEVVGRLVQQEHVEAASSRAASCARAAWPPDRVAIDRSSRPRGRPRSSRTAPARRVEVGAAERHPAVEGTP
jgi:hypothetical protein